jgi:hypothetical protein
MSIQTQNNKSINLVELSAGKYKIGLDKSSESKYIALANRWDLIIKCVNGEIFPYSSKAFGFHCTKKIIRNRLLKDHPEIAVRNWSDNGEAIFLFEQNEFELISKYAVPRKIRKLSENQRSAFVKSGNKALKVYRESNAKTRNMAQNQAIIR